MAAGGGVAVPSTSRVLFGSCNKAEWTQPLWEPILERRPDVWIWAGDNIYGDIPKFAGFNPGPPDHLRRLYAEQLANPGYQRLLNASVPMVATWDDHDYGMNDGDREYPYRSGSQEAFLDFIGEPRGSPRRQQQGVYTAKLFDFGAGVEPGRKVLAIMLDLRHNKDPYAVQGGDFLGQEQWEWLEHTLEGSAADVHIIVSSLQFLADRSVGPHTVGENWIRFPDARQRFVDLLARHNVSSPVILSGDVHFGELGLGVSQAGQLLEVTSSGMTHSWGTRQPAHPGPAIDFACHVFLSLAMRVMPWNYQLSDPVTGDGQYTLDLNFGELEFDWPTRQLNVSIRGEDGIVHLYRSFSLDALGLHSAHGSVDLQPVGGVPAAWRTVGGISILVLAALLPLLVVCATVLLVRWACRRARPGGRVGCSSAPVSQEDDASGDSDAELTQHLAT